MIGTKLAHYEITSHLGTGGMGEVYQATDSKLGRSVAIKLLPEALSHDNDRSTRFEREARVLASLNHPCIAAIYGLEESSGRKFLVMELVEGQTLAGRIKRGPIVVDEALGIAKQIAEALEAAHERGIIHRDLKPGNVMITPSGQVKVLDFGLAKVRQAEDDVAGLSNSPTLLTAASSRMILGTAAYMSPEQTKGNDAERTADVWAFGCVLYEMLTGRAVFQGETVGEILAEVLKTEPDWRRLPAQTPEGIRRLLRRCLQKEPYLRIRDIRDARIEIDESKSAPKVISPLVQRASRTRERVAWISALIGLVLVAGALALRHTPDASVKVTQFPILPPSKANFTPDTSQAISPNGRQVVFAATAADGVSMLWVRPLDSLTARPLAGTEEGSLPFWSPDSGSIGFFAHGKLKRIDIAAGLPQNLADASYGLGGAWGRDGVIVFSPNLASPLLQIPAGGGTAKPATRKDERRRNVIHMAPSFLPDGRHFLFWAGTPDPGVYVASLDANEVKLVLRTDSAATYSPPGYLLFMRQSTLMAQPFDAARMSTTGDPMPLAEEVFRFISQVGFSVSDDGLLVFRAAGAGQTELVWVDRTGTRIAVIAPPGSYGNVALSPDENHVAFDRNSGAGNPDVWLMDLRRRVTERFTFQPSVDNVPVWSADSRIVAFASERGGGLDIYQRLTNAGGPDEVLLKLGAPPIMFPSDWSSDGRYLTYYRTDAKTLDDIWALPLFGDRKPFPVLHGEFNENQSQFSPDVKWIAYVSDESGTPQIYVQSFPTLTGKLQLSTEGGTQPRWRRDGRELFYLAPNRELMEVTVKAGSTFEAETPRPLFKTRLDGAAQRQTYAVSADGNRFLLNVAPESGEPPLTIVINWPALLKK